MSTTSDTYLPRDAHQPRGSRPWCAACDTDRHLLVDSTTLMDPQQETLAAAVTCTNCGNSRVVATTAAFVAAIPERGESSGDLVHRDAAYLHCGEPMPPADPDLGNAHTVFSTESGPADLLAVYLRTRVLRCRCGFQMEIPRH
jgi:hypothetical protein